MVDRIIQHAPTIEITWIIGKVEYQLLKGMANVRFIVFDKKLGKEAYLKLQTELNNEEFDALFLMQVAFRANWAARLIKAKSKIGFDWDRSKELHWLFANQRVAAQKHAHVLEGFMSFADSINVPQSDGLNWSIPLTEEDELFAKSLCNELKSYAVISPAASKSERNWLPERYAQVADYLHDKGYQVVLCGGPADMDRHLARQIEASGKHQYKNLVGKTSLKQMLAVLKHAKLVIAPDTGPAHMATTVGTPVIGLYAHSNPRRTGPYLSLQHVVSVYDQVIEQQTGKTWQELPWGTRAKGTKLMQLIDAEKVIKQVDNLIGRH